MILSVIYSVSNITSPGTIFSQYYWNTIIKVLLLEYKDFWKQKRDSNQKSPQGPNKSPSCSVKHSQAAALRPQDQTDWTWFLCLCSELQWDLLITKLRTNLWSLMRSKRLWGRKASTLTIKDLYIAGTLCIISVDSSLKTAWFRFKVPPQWKLRSIKPLNLRFIFSWSVAYRSDYYLAFLFLIVRPSGGWYFFF